jgi:subtilisin family serine protease
MRNLPLRLALALLLTLPCAGADPEGTAARIEALRPGLLSAPARLALEAARPPDWLADPVEGRRRWWIRAPEGWRVPSRLAERRRGSGAGFWILELDGAELERLAREEPLRGLHPDGRLRPVLDLALPLCAADLVHGAPDGPWRGQGVLLGVVDSGIDPLHGDFWEGGRSRIRGIWDQRGGRRYDRAAIEAGQADLLDPEGHGTHVCAIAAGNGASAPGGPGGGPFVGFAPEAELLVVASTLAESDILAGVEWIFAEAEAAGLPCVVNLSLETQLGAHDGESLFENALEALTGPGRLLVVAAGNSGNKPVHHQAVFGAAHDVAFSAGSEDDLFVDAWIESPTPPEAELELPDGSLSAPFAGTRRLSGWTLAFPGPVLERGRWRVLLRLERGTPADAFVLRLRFADDRIRSLHAWGGAVAFAEASPQHTVGIPATGDSMLVAGSLVHRLSWTAADGRSWTYPGEVLGEVSSFSAWGPRIDGRQVPQVLLPGQGMFAALSRGYAQGGGLESWLHADGQHVLRQGTSMAAPALAGCLALALGKEPRLGPARADSLLRRAAGAPWDPRSGHGLLDAAALLEQVVAGLRDLRVRPGLDEIAVDWRLSGDWPGGEQRLSRRETGREDTLLWVGPALAGSGEFLDPTLAVGRQVRYRIELRDGENQLAGWLESTQTGLLEATRPRWTACGPNPTQGPRLRLAWLLPAAADLRWSLHDIGGRRLGSGSLGGQARGEGEAWIVLPPGAAGLQLLSLEAAGWRETRKLLRLTGEGMP